MKLDFLFFLNAVLFGIGLAMDAFSVSLANGLNEHHMKKSKMCAIAGVFGVFQFIMPLVGWICIHTVATVFTSFQKFIPWIALILLGYIGGKMLYEGIKNKEEQGSASALGFGALLVQGIATSIDALSVGFTISSYSILSALIETLIIGAVTFVICILGLVIGKKFGTRFAGKASILGGCILIGIGLEIFITGII